MKTIICSSVLTMMTCSYLLSCSPSRLCEASTSLTQRYCQKPTCPRLTPTADSRKRRLTQTRLMDAGLKKILPDDIAALKEYLAALEKTKSQGTPNPNWNPKAAYRTMLYVQGYVLPPIRIISYPILKGHTEMDLISQYSHTQLLKTIPQSCQARESQMKMNISVLNTFYRALKASLDRLITQHRLRYQCLLDATQEEANKIPTLRLRYPSPRPPLRYPKPQQKSPVKKPPLSPSSLSPKSGKEKKGKISTKAKKTKDKDGTAKIIVTSEDTDETITLDETTGTLPQPQSTSTASQ